MNHQKHPIKKEGPKVITLAALREPDQSLAIPFVLSSGLFGFMFMAIALFQ